MIRALTPGHPKWAPDSSSKACRICNRPFTTYTRRRHHCRECGDLVCHACSPGFAIMAVDYGGRDVRKPVRVCNRCYAARAKANKGGGVGATGGPTASGGDVKAEPSSPTKVAPRVIYQTRTVCPHCAVVERKGFGQRVDAKVVEREGRVDLIASCSSHGEFSTTISNNPKFFNRVMTFAGLSEGKSPLPDIEDMASLMKLGPRSQNLPLVYELSVFEKGEFVKERVIDEQLAAFESRLPPADRFSYVLQLNCGLVPKDGIPQLNRTLRGVEEGLRKGSVIVANMPVDRLLDLCELEDTALLRGRVFPAVKYYLAPGEESRCSEELKELMGAVRDIEGIRVVLDVVLEKPYPDLGPLFRFFFQHRGTVPLLTLTVGRSPRALFSRVMSGPQHAGTAAAQDPGVSLDELLGAIAKGSDAAITADSVVPVRAGMLLEPFLQVLGKGRFQIRPSPFCGFAACMVNLGEQGTQQGVRSIPLSRAFDLDTLFRLLLPVARKLREANGSISYRIYSELRAALKKSANKQVTRQVGDITKLMWSDSKAARQFARDLQFVIVHNHMDFAAIDLARRCQCAVLAPPGAAKQLTASCTRCI